VVAFLLEFLLGFGSGYFFIGWHGLGVGQLLLELGVFLAFCPLCCLCCLSRDRAESMAVVMIAVVVAIFIACFLSYLIWTIVTLVQIGGGVIPDATGVPLSGWI